MMQRLNLSCGKIADAMLGPILQQQHAFSRSKTILGLYTPCRKCNVLRLAGCNRMRSSSVSNGKQYVIFILVSPSIEKFVVKCMSSYVTTWFFISDGFTKRRHVPVIINERLLTRQPSVLMSPFLKQQVHKSTATAQIDHNNDYDSTIIPPYSNHSEETEFVSEVEEGVVQMAEKEVIQPNKKKKSSKNPLPSTTIDGRQLTYVEETKVIAEVDALIRHNRVCNKLYHLPSKRRGTFFSIFKPSPRILFLINAIRTSSIIFNLILRSGETFFLKWA